MLSADWVLPIEGPPIEHGAVAIEEGRIAAVGSADELGSDTHYDDGVLLPAFVNAHSHIEYAVYAGFGDSLLDFAEWIRLHTERKRRIGWEEYTAIARLGAAECLRSGIATIGDCSFSGAAAVASSGEVGPVVTTPRLLVSGRPANLLLPDARLSVVQQNKWLPDAANGINRGAGASDQ